MKHSPSWKIILAFFVDFIGSFVVLSVAAAFITGGFYAVEVDGVYTYGFHLNWLAILVLIIGIIAYFKLMDKKYGGTLGKRLLRLV
jgi:uncharacterized RDD family membrane protein YckC